MSTNARFSASCTCGQVAFEAVGAPIASAVCYCESCRSAARGFEQAEGAPPVVTQDGGVAYCLFRKDRVTLTRGAEHLREHRLKKTSPTRRLTAACCNAPMALDFTKGHWLNLFRDRLETPPPLEMGVMAKDRPASSSASDGVPVYPAFPPRLMIRMLAAFAAMGFRAPKPAW